MKNSKFIFWSAFAAVLFVFSIHFGFVWFELRGSTSASGKNVSASELIKQQNAQVAPASQGVEDRVKMAGQPLSPAPSKLFPKPGNEDSKREDKDAYESVTRTDGTGRVVRHRIMRAKFKYPLIQGEELADANPVDHPFNLQNARVADHLIVSAKPGTTEIDLHAMAEELGMTVKLRVGMTDMYLFSYPLHDVDSQNQARAALSARPEVALVDYDKIAKISAAPNDPSYGQLWGMPKISAPQAWDITTGSRGVVVGIIDSGIDYTHPDLAANIWSNPGETGLDYIGRDKRFNELDDDGNGYIDDWRGWDFVNNDNDPMDDNAHGTHCAGTIGAVANNGIGVAGVSWQVSMVPLKGLDRVGAGAYSDLIAALRYAANMNFHMTSNSWGGGYSVALGQEMNYVQDRNQLCLAAAGNNDDDNDIGTEGSYPASYPNSNIISVMSTGRTDLKSSFSSYGATTVDIAAPGEDIRSTLPNSSYDSYSGTSMATPHVAGACALLKAANPSLTTAQLKLAIMDGADVLPNLNGKCLSGARLNVLNSIILVKDPMPGLRSYAFTEANTGDGHLNPGEEAVGTVTLVNQFGSSFPNVVATITTHDPTVTIPVNTVNYGTLATGQASAGNGTFRILMSPGAAPHVVELTLTVTSSSGGMWTYPLTCSYVNSAAVSGYVLSAFGNSIAGAKVSWTGSSAGEVISRADGFYSIPAVDGTYAISASAPGFLSRAPISITSPPARTLDLILDTIDLDIAPTALSIRTNTGKAATGSFFLTSSGSLPVQWSISTNNYRFITSDQPGGPSYDWNDISTSGTLVSGLGDDTNLGPFPMGFSMPFYGQSFSNLRICSNGWMSFTSTENTYYNVPLPDEFMPENLIAPFMCDLDLSAGGTVHYKKVDSNTFVVQFTDVPNYWDETELCTFQVVLKSSGTIFFYYKRTDMSLEATVGLQDSTRTIGLTMAHMQSFLRNNMAIRIEALPQWLTFSQMSGTIPAGASTAVTATCNATGLALGTHTATLLINSNDMASPAQALPVSMVVVEGQSEPFINSWPTAGNITYGQPLSASTLSGGSAAAPGTFGFSAPNVILPAGTHNVIVVYTPDNTQYYSSLEHSVPVIVAKAMPVVTAWPAASSIRSGDYLSASTLSGGVASIPGVFAFSDPTGGFNGHDSFTFHVSDGKLISDPATVSITVGEPAAQSVSDLKTVTSAPSIFALTSSTTTRSDGATVVTFTAGSGTWTVPSQVSQLEVLVVAGGGGGGASFDFGNAGASGGGAGGLIHVPSLVVTAGSALNVTVGMGGAAGLANNSPGTTGADSLFGQLTARGGGGGAGGNTIGLSGGSGGGSRSDSLVGGARMQPIEPGLSGQYGYGFNGGAVGQGTALPGGGGGGAGAPGSGSAGGAGRTVAITGQNIIFGGGGGGGGAQSNTPGNGGVGGGGRGANYTLSAVPGTANRGGGGGGGNDDRAGARGGDGVVIIAYKIDNLPPVANAQQLATEPETNLQIQLSGSDPDGDALTFQVATQPTFGSLSGVAPNLVYTPPSRLSPGNYQKSIFFIPTDANNYHRVSGVVSLEVLERSPYEDWVTRYPSGSLNDPSADHDGDGMSNFHEFVFGLNPVSGASSNPIVAPYDKTTHRFSYTRRSDTALNYVIEVSTNLRDWQSLPPQQWSETETAAGDGVEIVEITLAPAPTAESLFMRVKAQ